MIETYRSLILIPDFKSSLATQRIVLEILAISSPDLLTNPNEFDTFLETFLRTYLSKGFPSLFSCVKSILKSNRRYLDIAHDIVSRRLTELETSPSEDATIEEMRWVLYFLAQHMDLLQPGSEVSSFKNLYLYKYKCDSTVLLLIRMMNKHIDLFLIAIICGQRLTFLQLTDFFVVVVEPIMPRKKKKN
jgi:hypothetical protein